MLLHLPALCMHNCLYTHRSMEGKSCYDIAIDKEDIRTMLDVHLLTSENQVNGHGNDSVKPLKGILGINR